jgi:hypothetical protein
MSCGSCQVPVGTTIEINIVDWAGCLTCNASVLSMFPRRGTHQGKRNDGFHVWVYETPLICPGCGTKSDGIRFECGNNGLELKLPLLIQLPIKENNQ